MKKFYLILLCGLFCYANLNAQIIQASWYIGASTNPGGASSVVAKLTQGNIITISGTGDMMSWEGNESAIPWYNIRASIQTLDIENGVTSIGGSAFSGCTGLFSVGIGYDVTSIGRYAFSGCTGLPSIGIPNSVTSIGYNAFGGCTGLTRIEFSNSVTSIGNFAFVSCTGLTTIEIPNSVTSIGDSTFRGCYNLFSFIVATDNPNFSSINGIVFNKQQDTLILYPAGIPGAYTIPNSVVSIGTRAFSGCTGLTSITIPNSVISIGTSAFSGCTGLTTLTIPNSVTSIGGSVFQGCSGLTSVSIGNSVASIGDYAFSYCAGLTTIEIPNSVTSIGNGAFQNCSGLASVSIGNSVASIGINAFSYCTGLTSIYSYRTTPPTASASAFVYVNASCCLYVPNAGAYKLATGWSVISCVEQMPDYYIVTFNSQGGTEVIEQAIKQGEKITEPTLPVRTGYAFAGWYKETECINQWNFETDVVTENITLYAKWNTIPVTSITLNKSTLALFVQSTEQLTAIVLPETATNKTVSWTSSVPSVATVTDGLITAISSGITTITASTQDGNFTAQCTVTVTAQTWNIGTSIATNVTAALDGGTLTISGTGDMMSWFYDFDIPWYDFRTSIQTVIINNGVTNIADAAFYGYTNVTSVTIGNSVTSIGGYAFFKCTGLTSIEIPNSVTSILYSAFLGCTGLTSIYSYCITPPSLGNLVFYGINASCCLYVPATSVYAYKAAEYWSDLSCILPIAGSEISVTSITLSKSIMSITVNDTEQLTATVLPEDATDKTVSWTSSDPSVATVTDGLITAISPGTTIITATTQDGNFTAQCSVTVAAIPVIGISLNKSTVSITINDTEQLTATVLPEDAADKAVSWTSSDPSVATVTDGLITAISPGTTIITATTQDGNFTAQCSVTVTEINVCSSPVAMGVTGTLAWTLCADGTLYITGMGSLPHYDYCNSPWYSWRSSILNVDIGNNVSSIGNYAFQGCNNLISANIPNSVLNIGVGIFQECSSLMSVTIPNSIRILSPGTFAECSNLKFITIPGSITDIQYYAFRNCSSLTSIVIPNSVTSIGQGAFSGSNNLTDITVNWDTPLSIEADVFEQVSFSDVNLHVPAGTQCTYATTAVWKDFNIIGASFSITPSVGSGGSISPNVEQSVKCGNSITFTATPNAGKQIDQWLLNGNLIQTGGTTYTVSNVQVNATLQVTFKDLPIEYFIIMATTSSGGIISPNGEVMVSKDGNQTFTFTPNANYEIDEVMIDGVVNSIAKTNGSYTFSNVNAAHSISATFIQNHQYTISTSSNPTASGATGGDDIYYSGSSCTVIATAYSGYTFENWTENGVVISTSESYTFTVLADRNLVANFIKIKSSDATLGSLIVSSGILSPAFNTNITNYTVEVTNDVSNITIDAIVNSNTATISDAGTKSLNVGSNTFDIIVTAEDGTMKTYTVTINRATVVSIGNISANQLSVYPNPAKNELFIKTDLTINRVEISDHTGHNVKILNSTPKQKGVQKISLSSLLKGVYLVKVYTDKGITVSKIVKK